MLSVFDVAAHFGLRADTVRRKIRAGEIEAISLGRTYRLDWPDVWACEDGPMPKKAHQVRYQEPLLSKQMIAGALRVSVKTVERWITNGLPTRKVFGATRCNPHDVSDWLSRVMGIRLPADWWKQ